jgi:hypothetical protein
VNLLKLVIFILIFGFINSCSRQSASGVSDPEVRNKEEQQRLDACSNLNLNLGILKYRNVLYLFNCTKWNKEFPHMYESISKIPADSWDQFFNPINEAFLDKIEKRNKIFKNIRELDSKNGLDDLSYVLVALNETNFFDSTMAMFKCVENPKLDICENRKNIPLKKSLKNIIHLVEINPEVISELGVLAKHLNVAIGDNQEKIRSEVNKFRFAKEFIPIRLRMVDSLAQKVKEGLSNEDRVFLSKILSINGSNQDVPWIYQWLKDEKFNRNKFRDLIEYSSIANPDVIPDLRAVKELYNAGINCTYQADNTSNTVLDFDLKTSIGDYVTQIKLKDYKSFYDFTSMHITGLKTASGFCKELSDNQYNANLVKIATKVAEFFSEKKNYDLIKFILNYSTTKADQNKNFEDNMYFGDLLTANLFKSANGLNGFISNSTREFFPVIYDVIIQLPPDAIINLAKIAEEVLKAENESKLVGIADFWSFFNDEEKNFVFNFVDRHFDKDINYVLLFDFYSKFLDDLHEALPILKDGWTGNVEKDEKSYLALQDLFYNLSGKETLIDFKKFFSRDQILKVLEILSNGQKIVNDAVAEIKYRDSTTYIANAKQEKYKYEVIKYNPGSDKDYDAKPLLECMHVFSDIQNGFYELVKNLPQACRAITNENISFRLFGWLNNIENDFVKYKKPIESKDSLFDDRGLLSPFMLNTNIGLIKIADKVVGPTGMSEPTKNGVQYILDSFNYYLNDKNGIAEIDNQLSLINDYSKILPEKNIIFRNSLIKSYSLPDNFSYAKHFFISISNLFVDFGNWIKNGNYEKAANRSLGSYDPNNSCVKSINQNISQNACPSKDAIKTWGNDILLLLQTTWEKEMGSPLKYLLTGFKMNGYLEIPLYGKETTKYRLTLSDNLKYLYDTFDKNLKNDVNNLSMHYVDEFGKDFDVNVTTIERVETVIREVRFQNNYLGATYLNHIVEGKDYNKDVKQRKFLMDSCIKIPSVRCGRPMSPSDLRMAKNALEAFNSLLDVNNGRGLEPKLNYGNFLKAFQQTLIASSSKAAQEVTFFPAKDEVLKQHNGRLLGDLTMINGYSNASRFVKDRIGRTRREFEDFLNREDFKRVDRVLLNGFDLNIAIPTAERIVNKLQLVPKDEKQNLFGATVDWVADLTYDESRLLEDTTARLLVVGSYLGTPDIVFNSQLNPKDFDRYKNNNLFQMFLASEKLIDYWPTLKNYFPKDSRLIDAIKPLNNFLYFLTKKLNETNEPSKNYAYIALNDAFLILQAIMFDDVQDGRIIGKLEQTFHGIDFVLEGLKNSNLVIKTYSSIKSGYKYSDAFFERSGEFFASLGQNINRLCINSTFDLTPIREYLNFSSKNAICVVGDSKCLPNYHYDEISTLSNYLIQKDDKGISNLNILNQKVFKENLINIEQMINEIMPCLRIKSVKVPLIVN